MMLKMLIKQITPPFIYNSLKYISNSFRCRAEIDVSVEREFIIGNRPLILPPNHHCDVYAKAWPLYDAFLPFLSKYLKDGWIIDIGANVGDTLYSVIDAEGASFFCIEPCEDFYRLLIKNVERLPMKMQQKIITKQCAISSQHKSITLHVEKGSAQQDMTSFEATKPVESIDLDTLIENSGIDFSSISLLKVDTDGFDWDCLLSASKILSASSALIFYENYYIDRSTCDEYVKLVDFLGLHGYSDFYFFDNVGNFILKASIGSNYTVKDLLLYLNIIKENRTLVPTSFFFDILVSKEACQSQMNIDNIIDLYRNL